MSDPRDIPPADPEDPSDQDAHIREALERDEQADLDEGEGRDQHG